MKLTARAFFSAFYWRLRGKRPGLRHMLSILPSFLHNAERLLRLVASRRPLLAIALVEHIGDIVVAEPIARLARQRHPQACIVWITRSAFVTLPANYPQVDAVIGVACLTEWMLLRRLPAFTEIWDLHIDGRSCPQCGIEQRKPALRLNADNYFEAGSLLDVECECAGLPRLSDGPRIVPPVASRLAVDRLALPARFIAIHCVSSDPQKDWPASCWQLLIAQLCATQDLAFVEVGTQALAILRDSQQARSAAGALTLLETAEVIRRAALYIGVDSGPAHLANAVGTRGVVLLGAYRGFSCYTPFSGGYADGTNATLVRSAGLVAELPVETVAHAALAALRDWDVCRALS